MTPTQQEPHRQRCETCDKCEKATMPQRDLGRLPYCDEADLSITPNMEERIERLGCASHSNAAHPSAPVPVAKGMLPCPELIEVETEPGLKEWVCRVEANPCKGDSCVYKKFAKNWKNGEEHDALVANKERERVLNEFEDKVKGNWEHLFGVLPYNDSVNKVRLIGWIQSLRQQEQP